MAKKDFDNNENIDRNKEEIPAPTGDGINTKPEQKEGDGKSYVANAHASGDGSLEKSDEKQVEDKGLTPGNS